MKKKIFVTCFLITIMLLSGCSKDSKENTSSEEQKSVGEVEQSDVSEETEESAENRSEEKATNYDSMTYEELQAIPFDELPQEGVRALVEKSPDYNPLSDEELETYEFGVETYGDDPDIAYMYFAYQPEAKIGEWEWLPFHTGGNDPVSMLGQIQTFLITEGYGDAEELNVVIGSEAKDDVTTSFDFTMTAYPEEVIKVIYYQETGEFGFQW